LVKGWPESISLPLPKESAHAGALAVTELSTQVPRESCESKWAGGGGIARQMAQVYHGDDDQKQDHETDPR